MEKVSLNKLREDFLTFFESKGHLRANSFSLVPQNDPSILLINAGMTPLKPYFTGAQKPPSLRMTTCQKCIRTMDIENVGKTDRHGTFFEMLGNFSFGDYFKHDAIKWAWEFFTKVLSIPEELLFVSVYEEDDEAYNIWKDVVGLPESKIYRLGKEDNFWEHGTGPCGPCSEIFFDRGIEYGCDSDHCEVGCDCDRFIEVWNLVFTQFDKQEDGSYVPLASKNIDTGMGLERLACVMQGVANLFEVDTIRAILDAVCEKAGVIYKKEYKSDVSIRLITDHIRSTVMMVSDGILPSNEGRGYVLRRLLRRAARHGKLLGIKGNFLCDFVKVVVAESGSAYPELIEKEAYIERVIRIEEERFQATVDQGLIILNDYIEDTIKEESKVLSGEKIFKLHDTYGFPYELTEEIAVEKGLTLDKAGFDSEMLKQKQAARKAHKAGEGANAWGGETNETLKHLKETEFVGYDTLTCESKVMYFDDVALVLDKTPFYAESGGQVADHGVIYNDTFRMQVKSCKKTAEGVFVHTGEVDGEIKTGESVTCEVDKKRRTAIARNHSTTHMLQYALRKVLGDHVEQSGSYVDEKRLRFDFTHFSAMTEEEVAKVQQLVNERIVEGNTVSTEVLSIDEARKKGATALFGEKYGDTVRVVSIGDFSMELCGGTHLTNSSIAGLFKIISESGVAAGVRRIEAATGLVAIDYFEGKESALKEAASVLKVSVPEDTASKASSIVEEVRSLRKEIDKLKKQQASGSMEDIFS
ncbi:MAG: alanine--tRNA ligase, partial [Clostridia bacterium]|nr:alanine--tRNA ligase [Clostridia bacterium]